MNYDLKIYGTDFILLAIIAFSCRQQQNCDEKSKGNQKRLQGI